LKKDGIENHAMNLMASGGSGRTFFLKMLQDQHGTKFAKQLENHFNL
jgi:hypothetical protein